MVWFFLVPAVPVTLGNFLIPLMIGARDLAFPRLNLFSWYLFMLGGAVTLWALFVGGVDTGLDLLYTALDHVFQEPCGARGRRHLHLGVLIDRHGIELHREHSQASRARHDLVSNAGVPMVALLVERAPGPRDPGARHHVAAGGARAAVSYRRVRSRRSAAIRSSFSIFFGFIRIRPST